jgi:hypothetical protein
VHHQLNSLGRVLTLEQGVFGASRQFRAVVEQRQDSDPAVLAPNLEAVELGPASPPEQYSPSYLLDSLGVSGKFPMDLTSEGLVVQWSHESLVQVGNMLPAIANTSHPRRSLCGSRGNLRPVQGPVGVALAIHSTDPVRQREVENILFAQNSVPVVIHR